MTKKYLLMGFRKDEWRSSVEGEGHGIEVDRGCFGKLTGSAFQPQPHIWALLRRIDLYSAIAISIFLDSAPSRPKTPISHHSCARTASAAAMFALDECPRWTGTGSAPDEAPGALGRPLWFVFIPKTGRFGPFMLVAGSQSNSQRRCFRETENITLTHTCKRIGGS